MINGKFQVLGMFHYFAVATAMVKCLCAEDQPPLLILICSLF